MKLTVTNTSKEPVFRFGIRFDPGKTVTIDDAPQRQYLALRAVRALNVQVVPPKASDPPGRRKPGRREKPEAGGEDNQDKN